jgi:hypothetical protein
LSSGAQNVIQTIGETLAPGTDATLHKVLGQVAVNTATNDGNLGDALTSTLLSFGTGMIGSQVADATGSKLIGSLASNATNQLVRTGDIDFTNLAGTAAGSLVGAEVAGETGSNLAGKVASTVTKNIVTDKDATTGLINLGVGEIINQGANAVNDFVRSTGVDSAITGEDQGDVVTTGSTENGEIAVAENDAENSGGLTSITGSDVTSTDTTGGLNQVASTDVTAEDTSTTVDDLTGQTTGSTNNVVTTGGLNQIAATDTTAATTPAEDVLATIGSDTGTTKNVGAVTGTEGDSTAATTDANTGAITGLVTGAATAGANAVKNQLVSTAKKNLTSSLTKSLTGNKTTAKRQPTAQQLASMRIASAKTTKPPIQMDVSKLMPVKKTTTAAPVTAPLRVDVSKLTPIKSTSNLTSILSNIKKTG